MKKNVPNQFIDFELILRADGNDGAGLTPTVRVKKDGGVWANGAGTVKEGENGSYEYEPTQAETNANHVVFKFTEATCLTVLFNVYPTTLDAEMAKVIKSGEAMDVVQNTVTSETNVNVTATRS